MRILFTDTDYNAHSSVMGGGGGGGSPYKITAACTFISSSRFRPSLTGLVQGRSAEPPRLESH